jgi:uncharacterized membrane protein YkvA (DUF1232 family)
MAEANEKAVATRTGNRAKKITRSERRGLKAKMKELLLVLPRMLKLLVRMIGDPRVSRTDKIILGGTILYVFVPLDFIPDMLPFIGQVDDSYLAAISILRMLNRANADVVSEHWDGDIDIKKLATSVTNVATFFLPATIKNLLTARVEIKEPKALRVVGGDKDKSS